MKQNNRKNTWKAIMAVMLVMATLFTASTVVSAGFVEFILGTEYAVMLSSSTNVPDDAWTTLNDIDAGNGNMWSAHTYNNVTEPKLPIGTTYTTHYTSSGGRVVTGADGTAWYSPNHYYSSWIQMR